MAADILFSSQGLLGIIILNRPQALNALSLAMIKAIQQQLAVWENDARVRVIIIKAAPGKAFCAGGDIRWLYEQGKAKDAQQLQFFYHEYRLNYYLQQYPKPIVSIMDGLTMGGGVGIAMHTSHPIATENYSFAMPETGIGFFPDIGASYLLAACPGATGYYLGLTGARLSASEAYALGLIKYQLASADLLRLEAALNTGSFEKDVRSEVSSIINRFQQAAIIPFPHHEEINDSFAGSSMEEIIENLNAHAGEWGRQCTQNLQKKSPLSLKITLMQLQKAQNLLLDDCLRMDYCLVKHFMKGHDFYEGVRALIVDKDKNPRWQPECLEDVSASMVTDYFEDEGEDLFEGFSLN